MIEFSLNSDESRNSSKNSHPLIISIPPNIEDTKRRILTEAEKLFRHYGYAKTTVSEIAAACGMSPANVYRFFASKAQINEAICDRIIADLEGQLSDIVRADRPASQRLTELIALLARHTLETLVDEKKVHDMVVVAMEEQWDAIQRHLETTARMIAEIIQSGIAAGEFRSQADVMRTARCVHCAIAALKHPVIVAQCRDDPELPGPQEMAAFVIAALKADSRS